MWVGREAIENTSRKGWGTKTKLPARGPLENVNCDALLWRLAASRFGAPTSIGNLARINGISIISEVDRTLQRSAWPRVRVKSLRLHHTGFRLCRQT